MVKAWYFWHFWHFWHKWQPPWTNLLLSYNQSFENTINHFLYLDLCMLRWSRRTSKRILFPFVLRVWCSKLICVVRKVRIHVKDGHWLVQHFELGFSQCAWQEASATMMNSWAHLGGGPIADKSKDILYELFSASVRVRACVGVLSAA